MRSSRLLVVALVMMLAACGSGGGGTRPSISATLPPDGVATTAPPVATEPGAPAQTPAPETAPPATAPPATAPPATAPPATAPPATAAPEPAPADTTVPTTDEGGGTVWWPWILGAVLLIGIIAAVAARRRRGPAWQAQVTSMLDEIDQLTGHLVAMTPEGLRAVSLADAATLARLRATLTTLTASAPDAAGRGVVSTLTSPLADLHFAVDAASLGAAPTAPASAASVTQLAARLHAASTSARAALATPR